MTALLTVFAPAASTRHAEHRLSAGAPASTHNAGHVGEPDGEPEQKDGTAHEDVPRPVLSAGPVIVNSPGYWSWALLDRRVGTIEGSANLAQTSSTESMIKVWIVSDFLRQLSVRGEEPTGARLVQASTAIRDSHDLAAEALFRAAGGYSAGGTAVVDRLIRTCGLTDTKPYPGRWSRTQMSSRDAARMGVCIADGRAAGPRWTGWVLSEMRQVSGGVTDQRPSYAPYGGGRWGIVDGLPAAVAPTVAIKNGWTPIGADNSWHVNCLAIHDDWTLAIMSRYPVALGLRHGANICRVVTEQLVRHANGGDPRVGPA